MHGGRHITLENTQPGCYSIISSAKDHGVAVFDLDTWALDTKIQVEIRAAASQEIPAGADFGRVHYQGRLRHPPVVADGL